MACCVSHVWREQRRRQGVARGVVVATIAVNSLLVDVIGAHDPVLVPLILDAAGDMQGIRRVVIGIDHCSGAAVSCTRQAAGIAGLGAGLKGRRSVHGLESRRPTVLRQIVVVHADAGANHQVFDPVGSVGDAQARRESFAVVVRNTRGQRQFEPSDGLHCRVEELTYARGLKQSEGRVPAQAVVDGQLWRHAPGVHGVKAESLNILREAAVTRAGATVVWQFVAVEWRQAIQLGGELGRDWSGSTSGSR